jgi:hypothetical protein
MRTQAHLIKHYAASTGNLGLVHQLLDLGASGQIVDARTWL